MKIDSCRVIYYHAARILGLPFYFYSLKVIKFHGFCVFLAYVFKYLNINVLDYYFQQLVIKKTRLLNRVLVIDVVTYFFLDSLMFPKISSTLLNTSK